MRPVVKICGVTQAADAEAAVELGADYVGCVLAVDSPRRANFAEVVAIRDAVSGRGEVVLVFRATTVAAVKAASTACQISRVQVHGASNGELDQLDAAGLLVHRVHSLAADATVLPVIEPQPRVSCPAVLDVGRGGTGRSFDWFLLGPKAPAATLIAGGLGPDNVADLVASHAPFGVDVSSGIESEPGVKDLRCMRDFFGAIELS